MGAFSAPPFCNDHSISEVTLCQVIVLGPGDRELQAPSSGREAEPLIAPSDLSMWADTGEESGNLCSGDNKEKGNGLMSLVSQSQRLPKVLKLKRLKQNLHFLDHAYTSTACFNMFCFRQLVLRRSVSLYPSTGCSWRLAPCSALSRYPVLKQSKLMEELLYSRDDPSLVLDALISDPVDWSHIMGLISLDLGIPENKPRRKYSVVLWSLADPNHVCHNLETRIVVWGNLWH